MLLLEIVWMWWERAFRSSSLPSWEEIISGFVCRFFFFFTLKPDLFNCLCLPCFKWTVWTFQSVVLWTAKKCLFGSDLSTPIQMETSWKVSFDPAKKQETFLKNRTSDFQGRGRFASRHADAADAAHHGSNVEKPRIGYANVAVWLHFHRQWGRIYRSGVERGNNRQNQSWGRRSESCVSRRSNCKSKKKRRKTRNRFSQFLFFSFSGCKAIIRLQPPTLRRKSDSCTLWQDIGSQMIVFVGIFFINSN